MRNAGIGNRTYSQEYLVVAHFFLFPVPRGMTIKLFLLVSENVFLLHNEARNTHKNAP
jgi:hypothetical protein